MNVIIIIYYVRSYQISNQSNKFPIKSNIVIKHQYLQYLGQNFHFSIKTDVNFLYQLHVKSYPGCTSCNDAHIGATIEYIKIEYMLYTM